MINRLGLDTISVAPRGTKLKKVFLAALVGATLGAGCVYTALKFKYSPIPIAIGALVGAIIGIALVILAIRRPAPIVYTEQKTRNALNNLFTYTLLNKEELNREGLFRVNGEPNPNLERGLISQNHLTGTEEPIEVCNLMKKYVTQLNIFQGCQQQLMEIADAEESQAVALLMPLIIELSIENREILRKYIEVCRQLVNKQAITKYTADALSKVIGPSLCPDVQAGELTHQIIEDIGKVNRAAAYLITHYDVLFASNNHSH